MGTRWQYFGDVFCSYYTVYYAVPHCHKNGILPTDSTRRSTSFLPELLFLNYYFFKLNYFFFRDTNTNVYRLIMNGRKINNIERLRAIYKQAAISTDIF